MIAVGVVLAVCFGCWGSGVGWWSGGGSGGLGGLGGGVGLGVDGVAALFGEVEGGEDGGEDDAGEDVAEEGGYGVGEVLVGGDGLGHGLDAGEGADEDVGGLGGDEVGEEFALGAGFFEEFLGGGAHAEEGAAAVEAVGALVEGEADGGADHGVGLEAVGVEHGGVDEFLDFAGPVGDGGSEVLSGEDALGELFF